MFNFLLDFLPIIATVFLTLCYFPQIDKNRKTKNVESHSLWFWILLNIALGLMWVNSLMIFIKVHTFGYLITETINLGLALTVLLQVLIYRKK